jgi:hypothetical protein
MAGGRAGVLCGAPLNASSGYWVPAPRIYFTSCFVRAWKLVSRIERRRQTKEVWEGGDENTRMKWHEVRENYRLRNFKILCSSRNCTRVIKSKGKSRMTHRECTGEMRNKHTILVGKPKEKWKLWRPRSRWKDNIKTDKLVDIHVARYKLVLGVCKETFSFIAGCASVMTSGRCWVQ